VRNHIKEDCFKLKRKKQPANSTQLKKNVPPSTVVSVSEPSESSTDTIAFVGIADTKKIVTDITVLKISKIGTSTCNLLALLDTRSPISFISHQTWFYSFFELAESSTIFSCSYNVLNGTPIQIKNSVTTSIELKLLSKIVSNVTFHILKNNILSYNLIFSRNFLTNNNISFTYESLREDLNEIGK